MIEATLRELAPRYDFTVYAYASPEAEGHIPGVKVVHAMNPT